MSYKVYRADGTCIGSFETQEDAQTFINTLQYDDVAIEIRYE